MKKHIFLLVVALCTMHLNAKNYYVATDGNDNNLGTIEAPFATLNKAHSKVVAGDTVFFRGGTYQIQESQIMKDDGLYAHVFHMDKSGTAAKRICYFGYPGEQVVFNLSAVRPSGRRISVFWVDGSYLHFKNFEIVGTQVTITGHTQSECISARGGSNNIFECLSMHDGMAIGYYQTKGSNNLVLNCDAYNNYDNYSEGTKGGNVDGFGGHVTSENDKGNLFKGCRAWWNSDDGFDFINCKAAFVIDSCWAFYNGYQPGTKNSAGDGTGFKAGGYGMSANPKVPTVIPMHEVHNSLAYYNKNKGFYSNHHLGGIVWINNTGFQNPSNYCMLNRKSAEETVDVGGYGHIIKNNVSFTPRTTGAHMIDVNASLCEIENNSFAPTEISLTTKDFVSVASSQLTKERNADGSLPDIGFLKAKSSSPLAAAGMGYAIEKAEETGINAVETITPQDIIVGGIGCISIRPAESSTQIRLHDINGALILSQSIDGAVCIEGLKPGFYILNGKRVIVR